MEKLLAIASLAQKVYGRWLFQHLLVGVMIVVALVFVTSILISAILIGSSYWLYFTLINSGMQPQYAFLIVGAALVFLTGVLALSTWSYLRHLRNFPRRLTKRPPRSSRATEAVELSNIFTALLPDTLVTIAPLSAAGALGLTEVQPVGLEPGVSPVKSVENITCAWLEEATRHATAMSEMWSFMV